MDRRQEILEAAAKSFSLFGYKATTMGQVAKIANVGKGTIYTFFSNKKELFNVIVMKMIHEMRVEADAVIIENATFEKNIHAALMRILNFRESHQLYAKLLDEAKELHTFSVRETLKMLDKEIVSYIRTKVENAISKGELQTCDTELIAYLLFKSYIALVIDWKEHHDETLAEERIVAVLSETIFKRLSNEHSKQTINIPYYSS